MASCTGGRRRVRSTPEDRGLARTCAVLRRVRRDRWASGLADGLGDEGGDVLGVLAVDQVGAASAPLPRARPFSIASSDELLRRAQLVEVRARPARRVGRRERVAAARSCCANSSRPVAPRPRSARAPAAATRVAVAFAAEDHGDRDADAEARRTTTAKTTRRRLRPRAALRCCSALARAAAARRAWRRAARPRPSDDPERGRRARTAMRRGNPTRARRRRVRRRAPLTAAAPARSS